MLRVAAVGHLNASPLTVGLPWPITFLRPADFCGSRLRRFDLILAPVVTAFTDHRWQIATDAPYIGCCGAVGSVRLEMDPGKNPLNVQTIALSPDSRTSNALTKILLTHYWKRNLEELDFLSPDDPAPAEARLIIGDNALLHRPEGPFVDLGAAWYSWHRLPFVFAAWMSRYPLARSVIATLRAICQDNLSSPGHLLTGHWRQENSAYLITHLTRQLCYASGPAQLEGLSRFRALFCAQDASLNRRGHAVGAVATSSARGRGGDKSNRNS